MIIPLKGGGLMCNFLVIKSKTERNSTSMDLQHWYLIWQWLRLSAVCENEETATVVENIHLSQNWISWSH